MGTDRPAGIHEGMTVLANDGSVLGSVFAVGSHSFALERGFLHPREWRVGLDEIARIDERGVWLLHGREVLERISDAFSGPTEPYRAAAMASPMPGWTGFDPPAEADEEAPSGASAGTPSPGGTSTGVH